MLRTAKRKMICHMVIEGLRYIVLVIGLQILISSPCFSETKPPSYDKEILPILEEHCFDCHGDGAAKGGLSLDQWKTSKERLQDMESWKDIMKNVASKTMPPAKKKSQPSDEERKKIVHWIESEVFRFDPDNPDPGRVTIRRLNRTEYNNTVKDLMMVDFSPADDFPPDDTGYGFDNIGDVLSLSPVLLEKYLKASDQITSAAIRTFDPPEKIYKYEGADLIGGQPKLDGRILGGNGSVKVKHNFLSPGKYSIKISAGADQAGDEPAKMSIIIDGKKIKTFDVKNLPKDTKLYEVILFLDDTKDVTKTIDASFINDFYDLRIKDPKRRDRNLFVNSFEIEGPLGREPDPIPKFHQKVFGELNINSDNRIQHAKSILWKFTNRAYRRKVPETEIDRLLKFVQIGIDEGGKYAFEKGIKLACQAVLTSPFFLFRGEIQPEPDNPDATYRIDEHSLASRLSYFIWSTMPDDELFKHATESTLRKNLRSQVLRMLKDPKAKALTENFAGQWLQLRDVPTLDPDPKTYGKLDSHLKSSMQRETQMLFEHVLKEDLPITELISAEYSFLNKKLANHYGIKGVEGNEFQKISLKGTRRRGMLTHASVLTVTSNPTRTSPVKRGKWILENILGTPPPDPPPDVEELDNNKELKGNLRQRLEQHRDDPNCASCHALMDPLGFVYENFDGVGKWRDEDEGSPIITAGELVTGESFNNHEEFQKILTDSKLNDYLRCSSEIMMTYALGRGVEFYDKPAIESVVKSLKSNDLKISSMVLGIVESVPFQYRRGDGRRIYD
ncbi:MAG: hypothetical protein CMP45_01065 [Rickettsiales bacterium]|nr:hypothetical protein [Rickettsiales bacterium]